MTVNPNRTNARNAKKPAHWISSHAIPFGWAAAGWERGGEDDLCHFIFSADSRVLFTPGIQKLKTRRAENLNATVQFLKILKTSLIPALIYLHKL